MKPVIYHTIGDILNELGEEIGVLVIVEDGIGHAYFDFDDFNSIDIDIWRKPIIDVFIVSRVDGFEVVVEV